MNKLKTFFPVVVILLVLTAVFWPMVTGKALMKWDAADLYLPWKNFICECLRNKLLPLWNPFMDCGFSQMADPGTWYPVSWLFGLFSRYTMYSLSLEYLFHIGLVGIGFFYVARQYAYSRATSIVLAVSLMLSGFFISNAQHIGWLAGASWFVWTYYYSRKLVYRPDWVTALKLGFVLFFLLSGGYPGVTIITLYIVFAYFLIHLVKLFRERTTKRFILYGGLSLFVFLLFSSVVLISSFELKEYYRTGGLSPDSESWGLLTGSLPVNALITFIAPFAGTIKDSVFWTADFALVNCYFGLPLLFLAIYSAYWSKGWQKSRIFFIIGLAFLATALAEVFPFRLWLSAFPFMDVFRFSTLFRFFAIFFFLLSAGSGLEKFRQNHSDLRKVTFPLIGFGVVLFLVLAYLFIGIEKWMIRDLFLVGYNRFVEVSGIKERAFFSICLQGFFLLGIAVLTFYLPRRLAFYGICGLIILDIAVATRLNAPFTVYENYSISVVDNALKSMPLGYPKPSLDEKMEDITDANPKFDIPYLWVNQLIYYKVPASGGGGPYSYTHSRLARQNGHYKAVIDNPLVFYTDNLMPDGSVDTSTLHKIEKPSIRIISFDPNHISCEITDAPKTGYMVLLQNIYPGWSAKVNNISQPIRVVNSMFMAVPVKAGTSKVEFVFRPRKAILLAYVSIISFCVCLIIAFWRLIVFSKSKPWWRWATIVALSGMILFAWLYPFNSLEADSTELNKLIKPSLNRGALTLIQHPEVEYYFDVYADLNHYMSVYDLNVFLYEKCKSKSEIVYFGGNSLEDRAKAYIVRKHFPFEKTVYKKNGLFVYIGTRFGREKIHSEEVKTLTMNDFESSVPGWGQSTETIVDFNPLSGKMCNLVSPVNQYSSTFSIEVNKLGAREGDILAVEFFARFDSMQSPSLVFQVDRANQNGIWDAQSIPTKAIHTWMPFFFFRLIDNEILSQPGNNLKVYLYNTTKANVYIDDFKIVLIPK